MFYDFINDVQCGNVDAATKGQFPFPPRKKLPLPGQQQLIFVMMAWVEKLQLSGNTTTASLRLAEQRE